MRKLGVKMAGQSFMALYKDSKSCVRVNGKVGENFQVKVGVHMVLQAISREFKVGLPWELLYADGLVLIAESMDELVETFKQWKDKIEAKGLTENVHKTKISGLRRNLESGHVVCVLKRIIIR